MRSSELVRKGSLEELSTVSRRERKRASRHKSGNKKARGITLRTPSRDYVEKETYEI